MSVISNVWTMKLVVTVILLLQLAGGQSSALNDKLVEEFSKMTGYTLLNQKYKEIKSNKTSPSTKSQNLSEIFIKRLQILQKTVEKVESRLKTYVPPELDEDSIMWARNLSESLCDLQERGFYKQPICLKNSSVHIPVDIFKGDKNMLRNVSWSSLFDEVWIQNLAVHPDLLWQYFGSTSGLLRFYPGTSWPLRYKDKEDEDIDLYDVRRRSWFVQGMSLPKDMLILIDSSGSSQGQALALMKHITRSLLETLNENDQINILTFPQDTNEMYRPACFSSFVKATFRNKQVALDYTKKIISTGIANFSKALEASFTFFENITSNASEGFSGSHCNQMIMLLTDGGNEKPREVLRKYNSFKKIRIFTYLIGPISTDAPAIKWIAEKSRGKFYQIPSIVAIRSETQDYIRFLSESKANEKNALTWTSAGLDYLNDELVVSVTAPLFNKSSEGKTNKTILGVLGIDLPARQFVNSLPYELGEYGYFFIINSQGYVLYHPRLLDMREEFLNVDILDLETDVNMEEIRRKMIDGEKGELSVDDYDDMLDEHHVNVKRRTYRYEPVQGTEFSLCVVLYDEVKEGVKETKITGSVDSEIFFTIHDTDVILDDSKYCTDEEDEEEGNTTEIERFSERITKFKCDVDKLKGLIFDILQTNSTGNLWIRQEEEGPGIVVKFIETSNMFRLYPQNSSEYLLPKYLNFKERISKSQQWFVAVYDKEMMVDNETAVILLIAHRITNGNLTMAVIGGLVLEQWLQNNIFGEELVEPDNKTDTISYLLDDGGIIISTNLYPVHSTHYVGQFFGKDFIEGEVMKHMINRSIYKMHRSTGYLANCRDLELVGFSPRIESFVPFVDLFSPKWWLSVFVTQLSWLTSVFQVLMSFLETLVTGEVFFGKFEIPKESEYCAKEFFKYTFADKSQEEHSHTFDCGNCTKSYTTEMLKDLNAILVKVTSEESCKCPESSEPLKFHPQPNLNETHLRSSFYRKYVPCQPYFSEKEESYSFGVRCLLSPELLATLVLIHHLFGRVDLV